MSYLRDPKNSKQWQFDSHVLPELAISWDSNIITYGFFLIQYK